MQMSCLSLDNIYGNQAKQFADFSVIFTLGQLDEQSLVKKCQESEIKRGKILQSHFQISNLFLLSEIWQLQILYFSTKKSVIIFQNIYISNEAFNLVKNLGVIFLFIRRKYTTALDMALELQ